MSTGIRGVEVELGRLSTDWRKFGITVKVWSQRKPGLKATNEIDPATVTTAQAVIQLVGAAGGTCAEYLGERYRDNIDPTEAARLAMRAFVEEMRMVKELATAVPMKLMRLRSHVSEMNNNEQEFLERCKWFIDRNQELTPAEVRALDAMIARLHAGQV